MWNHEKVASQASLCEALACPCVVYGRVVSAVAREDVEGNGMGRRGRAACIFTACCPWILPCWVVGQRWRLMRLYGIRGGWWEAAKGLAAPCALAQHSSFVATTAEKNRLRWPWESPRLWDTSARPPAKAFDVVVLGSPGASASELVRALAGLEQLGSPGSRSAFAVATRLVHVPGYPMAVLNLWEVDAGAEIDLPADFAKRAHGVLCVFDADSRRSLEDAARCYSRRFLGDDDARPPVRVLLGNVHRYRFLDDACDFLDDVDAAATRLDMQVCTLAAHAPTAHGTKLLLETLATQIWNHETRQSQPVAAAGAS